MTLRDVSLNDKYLAESGRIYLTGTQALVRLPIEQKRRDVRAGLNTAGLVTGYRGSPLSIYDQELWKVSDILSAHDITFQSGLNEELAATAIWGAQQVGTFGTAKYDGVFGIWYGKNPGFDRAGDALKHANFAGSSKHGGALAVIGDDHAAKSSDIANQSDYGAMNHLVPMLFPSDVQDVIDFGFYGFALSRYSGCWTGFKVEPNIMDRSQTIETGYDRGATFLPVDFDMPPEGLGLRWPDNRFQQEARMLDQKLPAVYAFMRANPQINRTIFKPANARLGIVTVGKSYLDVREALAELGVDEKSAGRLGVSLLKIGQTWPLDPDCIHNFCKGLQEVLVVEEKQPVLESQIRSILYNWPESQRPRITGKTDEFGTPLLRPHSELDAVDVATAIAARILNMQPDADIESRRNDLAARASALAEPAPYGRKPYFCSGCPHSTSIRHPEGTRAAGGIGCHWMAVWTPAFATECSTQMGGEGMHWVGQAPFVSDTHIFQNLGDGTYSHSGSLAIRAAVAAKVNITYKILYNDAVAMTGGQPVEGRPDVAQISRQLAAEGVRRIAVVSDEPGKYTNTAAFTPGATFHGRDQLDAIQRDFAATPGVTAIIYDQTCAAEKRRRRKRNEFPDPPVRMFINDLVCEGCGDCGVKSNCVSIEPLETPFGRKRAINQSSCNKDYSCKEGFCPSFVTVENARPRRRAAAKPPEELRARVSDPGASIGERPHNLLITGIGGTGVVTIGALIGMAAHLDGKSASVLDSIGLAQKNGSVVSYIRLSDRDDALHSARVPKHDADAMIACDLVVAADREVMNAIKPQHTRAVINTHIAPPPEFVFEPDLDFQSETMMLRVTQTLGRNNTDALDAHLLTETLLGDGIAMNLFMLGYAFQQGLVPLSAESLLRAIELNGVSIAMNKSAFEWGRIAAVDLDAVLQVAGLKNDEAPETLDDMIARRAAFLVEYQDQAYASRYQRLVEVVDAREQAVKPGATALTEAVARNYFKLLAYKDEYEVARLHVDPAFAQKLNDAFEDGFTLRYNLAPPLISKSEPLTGRRLKRSFGPWLHGGFKVLAKMKRLRGGRFDVFGWQADRRMERALIAEYEGVVSELLDSLTPDNHALAAEVARTPETMRGFGHVKEANVAAAEKRQAELLARFRAGPQVERLTITRSKAAAAAGGT